VYGPVRTVVWQGSAGDRRPYADHRLISVATLVTAAQTGALENVRINLDSILDQTFRVAVEMRLKALV
jgi:formiminotetrahydrofolate cyclodeaminase